ncbi:MAG TPA: type II secretion system F family protein, partial [Pseudomonadales bacterium]|nr:type II secretion system F family protein [Pseudomonadales bacterium]
MPRFHYRGRNRAGAAVSGSVEAGTEDGALTELLNQGITPIAVLPMTEQVDVGEWIRDKLPASVKLEELIIFCRQMYALTKAGIPVINALNGLADTMRNVTLKKTLKNVVQQLESGVTLATAMQHYPRLFSPIVISMVHVGENTGRLEQAFLQTAAYLELERETKKRISQATRYPSFVLSAIGLAMVVLNVWVIPTFAKTFAKLGAQLPIQTRILMATSNFFVTYWPELLTGFVLTV